MNNVTINGDVFPVDTPTISYEQVVAAIDKSDDPPTYSVKYTRGPVRQPDGILSPGRSIPIADGMCLSAYVTGCA